MAPTYKVSLIATEPRAEAIAALLSEALDPPPAVSISESGNLRLVEAYFEERPNLDALTVLIGDRGTDAGALPTLTLHEIPDEDWVARVQRGLHPVKAGRFLIHGSHDREAGLGKRFAIEIDAGRAFGTAHHGTTRGCLMAIDALAKRERWRRVLDVGTGSGILAIAVAKVSNAQVLASDIDRVAVAVARENFRRNDVPAATRALTAGGTEHPAIRDRAPFDLITANILAPPLIKLAPRLAGLAAPGGHVVLSGLLDGQTREVCAAYLCSGLVLEGRLSLEGWTTLILRKV